MKVLVFSSTAWSSDNSFGNSFTNFFEGTPLEFASIYCRPQKPNNPFDMQYFQITEKLLIQNLRNKKKPAGIRVYPQQHNAVELNEKEQKGFDQARKARWMVLFWARDLLWKIGRWKSKDLHAFLDEVKPDVIFYPIYYPSHLNVMARYFRKYSGAPMVGYIADDFYTMRQFRLSPLYWIDRLFKRRQVKKTIEQCELLYVISDIQKREYEKVFTPPCKILTKCADFSEPAPVWPLPQDTVKLLYAGNLGVGRWKSLAMLSGAIERLRAEGLRVRLDIYSATPMTKAMEKALCKDGSEIHEPVSYGEILKLQREADIMLHVEGMSLKSRLAVHQSFSTKLVDFFGMGKCIFAIGPYDVASMDHLIKSDAAVTARSQEEVYEKLKQLLLQPEDILHYGEKAYVCGKMYHDKAKMQSMLVNDLNEAAKKK